MYICSTTPARAAGSCLYAVVVLTLKAPDTSDTLGSDILQAEHINTKIPIIRKICKSALYWKIEGNNLYNLCKSSPLVKQLYVYKEVLICHRFYEQSFFDERSPWSKCIQDLQLAMVGPSDVTVQ